MPRPLRNLAPGMVVEITIRTIHGRHLLRPSDDINEIVLGILGRAQQLFGIRIHAFMFMSNHYHLIITIPDAHALAKFECYLNGNLAKEAGRLHGWREKAGAGGIAPSPSSTTPRWNSASSTSCPTAAKRGSWRVPRM